MLVAAPVSMFVIEEAWLSEDIPVRVPADAQLLDRQRNPSRISPSLSRLPPALRDHRVERMSHRGSGPDGDIETGTAPGPAVDVDNPAGGTWSSARRSLGSRVGSVGGGTP